MKRSKSHSTYIHAALPVVLSLEKMDSVRSYVLSVIASGGRGHMKRIRVQVWSGAVKISVSGGGATQAILVYPRDGSLEGLVDKLQSQQEKWEGYKCIFPETLH